MVSFRAWCEALQEWRKWSKHAGAMYDCVYIYIKGVFLLLGTNNLIRVKVSSYWWEEVPFWQVGL